MRKINATSLLVLLCACSKQASGTWVTTGGSLTLDGKGYATLNMSGDKVQFTYTTDGDKIIMDMGGTKMVLTIEGDGSIGPNALLGRMKKKT
jgi:uncharacterized lipoprotein YehR (DUF1307 family)